MMRILVVDDEVAGRAAVVRLLRSAGYEVLEAETGERGVALAHSARPDLVLMDVNLPGVNGLDAARRIKADPTLANTFVVNLSARRTSIDDEAEGLDAGADGYITRPVPNRKLLALVKAFLRQQQMAVALRRSEAQVQRLVHQSPDGMLVVAPGSGKILFANPAAAGLFGRAVDQLIGHVFGNAVPDGLVVEMQIVRPDGADVTAEVRAGEVDWAGQPALLVSLHDVTVLRRTAIQLAQSEQRYRSLFEQNPDAVCELDPQGRIVSGNKVFEQLSGYSLAEARAPHYRLPIANEQLAAATAGFLRALGGEAVNYESVGISKSGQRVDLHVTNLPIVVDHKIIGVYGIAKDITASKQAARALHASEQRLAMIVGHAANGILVLGPRGQLLQCNPAFCQMLGYSESELHGRHVQRLTHPDDRRDSNQRIGLALAGREAVYAWDMRLVHRDHSVVWVRACVSLVRSAAGEHLQSVCIFENISARREAEEALRRSQRLLDIAGRTARLGGWFYELPQGRLQWSDMVAELHDEPPGFTPTVDAAIAYYAPEHIERIRAAFGRCVSDGQPFDQELQIISAHGRRRWVRAIGEAVRDADGCIVLVQGAFQLIDDRKAAETALRELAVRLTTTLESITDAFFTLDRDWRFSYVNHRAEELLQRKRESLLGRNVWQEFPQAVGTAFQHRYEAAMASHTSAAFEAYYAPLEVWLEVTAYPSLQGLAVSFRDVTERRRNAERMRLLEACIERSNDIVMICEADQADEPGPRTVYVNPAFERYTGYTPAEALGRSPRMLQGPLTDRAALHRVRQALVNWQPVREELINYTKDGRPFWIEMDITPVADETGGFTHWLAVERDITARKQADLRLRQELVRLDLLQQITRSIGAHHDLRSIFGVLCERIERDMPVALCAVARFDALAGTVCIDCLGPGGIGLSVLTGLVDGARLPIDLDGLSRAVKGEWVYEAELEGMDFELPRRLATAGLHSVVLAPLRVNSKVMGLVIAARVEPDGFSSMDGEFLRQVSEHVALAAQQAQLYQSLAEAYDDLKHQQQSALDQERLRALGQMASGIAHDINNAITPITLYTEWLLASEPGLSARARDSLGTIQMAIDDVAETVARMRNYAKPHEEGQRKPIQLNTLIDQVVDLTQPRWKDEAQRDGRVIDLQRDLDSAMPVFLGVEGELRDALTNLIFNAVDAMPQGGRLTLRTRMLPAPMATAPTGTAPTAELEVVDTGIGMDDLTRRRCMDPFFTTKGERGTGLGLGMVIAAVRRHGGEIEIDSRVGEGTTVRLRLVLQAPAQPALVPAQRNKLPPLHLLVIDDDPLLLRALSDVLREDGHQVATAGGGNLGIEAFIAERQADHPFDAVITDLGMPHVDGHQVAQAIKTHSPETPVLMLTGWGRRMQDEGDMPPHVDVLLSKPPRLSQLQEALRSALAKNQA